MKRANIHIAKWVLVIILACVWFNESAVAQDYSPKFGISFTNDLSTDEIISTLPDLIQNGVSIIELRHPADSTLLNTLWQNDIKVLIRSDLEFVTRYENEYFGILNDEIATLSTYARFDHVIGLGIPSYSMDLSQEQIQQLESTFDENTSIDWYQIDSRDKVGVSTIQLITPDNSYNNSNQHFFEAPFSNANLNRLIEVLENKSSLVLMDWYWYSDAIVEYSFIAEALQVAATEGSSILSGFNLQEDSESNNWPIFVLVLIWLSLGVHLNFNLTYRSLIPRFFTFHRFFVDDIMRYRERSAASGVTLFIQHTFFSGLVFYALAKHFISAKGLEAFYFHYPILGLFGQNYFSIFIIIVVVSLAITFLHLFWLYIPSKSLKHFSQIINLYSWMFHLDFIIGSILLINVLTGGSTGWIAFLGTLFILVWAFAFILAAYDNSKYLINGKFRYLFITVGIFIVVTIGLIVGFLFSGYPYEVLQLAIQL